VRLFLVKNEVGVQEMDARMLAASGLALAGLLVPWLLLEPLLGVNRSSRSAC
jgi:hypothetical protein